MRTRQQCILLKDITEINKDLVCLWSIQPESRKHDSFRNARAAGWETIMCSSYLVELLKHDSGLKYVRIEHILGRERASININPNILSDLIEVLNNRNLTIVDTNEENLSREIRDKAELVQSRYLKGVPINNLIVMRNLLK